MTVPANKAAAPYTMLANALLLFLSGTGLFLAAHASHLDALYGLAAGVVGLGSVLLATGSVILDRRLRQQRLPVPEAI